MPIEIKIFRKDDEDRLDTDEELEEAGKINTNDPSRPRYDIKDIYTAGSKQKTGGIRLFVFDVGQGSFNMIFHKDSQTLVIIDAGTSGKGEWKSYTTDAIKDGYNFKDIINTPAALIAYLINEELIKNFIIIVTHHDKDHYNLLTALILRLSTLAPSFVEEILKNNTQIYLNSLDVAKTHTMVQELSPKKTPEVYNEYLKKLKTLTKEELYGMYFEHDIYRKLISSTTIKGYIINSIIPYNQLASSTVLHETFTLSLFSSTFFKLKENSPYGLLDNVDNEVSIIVKAFYKNDSTNKAISILFPGDAPPSSINYVIEQLKQQINKKEYIEFTKQYEHWGQHPLEIKSDILIGSHHGASRNQESDLNILRTISPEIIVYSNHKDSKYGHITSDTYSSLSSYYLFKNKIPKHNFIHSKTESSNDKAYFTTAAQDTLLISSRDAKQVRIRTFKPSLKNDAQSIVELIEDTEKKFTVPSKLSKPLFSDNKIFTDLENKIKPFVPITNPKNELGNNSPYNKRNIFPNLNDDFNPTLDDDLNPNPTNKSNPTTIKSTFIKHNINGLGQKGTWIQSTGNQDIKQMFESQQKAAEKKKQDNIVKKTSVDYQVNQFENNQKIEDLKKFSWFTPK